MGLFNKLTVIKLEKDDSPYEWYKVIGKDISLSVIWNGSEIERMSGRGACRCDPKIIANAINKYNKKYN